MWPLTRKTSAAAVDPRSLSQYRGGQRGEGPQWKHLRYLFRRATGQVDGRPPFVALPVELGDGLTLTGFDAQPASVSASDALYVQLHWRVHQAPAGDWKAFVHLVDGQENGAGHPAGGL